MKVIKISGCVYCPYATAVHCGRDLICNHPSVIADKPYSEKRLISDKNKIAEFCKLP